MIVLLNIERKKVSVSNVKEKFWTEIIKDTLSKVKTLETKKKLKRKAKVCTNTEKSLESIASNASKILYQKKPKSQQTAF